MKILEILNDVTVTTGSVETKSFICKSLHKIYIQVLKVTTNVDLDLVTLSVYVGNKVAVARASLETLAAIWAVDNGGDVTACTGGDQTVVTGFGVDLGKWIVPESAKVTIELDNGDAESVAFTVSALVDGIGSVVPLRIVPHADTEFSVDNLVEAWLWDSDGDLSASATDLEVAGHLVKTEQAWLATVAESKADIAALFTFARAYQADAPIDTVIRCSSSALTVVTVSIADYSIQESAEINKIDLLLKKSIMAKRSGRNLVTMRKMTAK